MNKIISDEDASLRRVLEAILVFLASQPGPVSELQIGRAVKGRKQIKVRALRMLVSQLKVCRQGRGTTHYPYLYSIASAAPVAQSVCCLWE